MTVLKNDLTTQPSCSRNPNTFFKHTASASAVVIISASAGVITGFFAGFILHQCFSPKPSNILAGFIVAIGYGVHRMELDYQKQLRLNRSSDQCPNQKPVGR